LAQTLGVASVLIENPEQINLDWFAGAHSVALTAGASAPEELVKEFLQWLSARFALKIEEKLFRTKTVNFVLPASVLSTSGPTVLKTA
jgi:4-hydroxy-3-methylbut-2-en-1-yl diphosphate reductase